MEIGEILYFPEFPINEEGQTTPKLVLILNRSSARYTVAWFSSQQDLMEGEESKTGCVADTRKGMFIFQDSHVIDANGDFSFEFDCFCRFSSMIGFRGHSLEDCQYDYRCTLKPDILNDFLDCIRNSKTIERKFTAELFPRIKSSPSRTDRGSLRDNYIE